MKDFTKLDARYWHSCAEGYVLKPANNTAYIYTIKSLRVENT